MPTLKETLKDFDKEITKALENNVYALICDNCGGGGQFDGDTCSRCNGQGLTDWNTTKLDEWFKSFLSQSIKTALESVVVEDKTFPEYQSDDFDRGYKFAREQQIKNNEKYLK